MKQKLVTLFLVVLTGAGSLFAWDYEKILINGLYFNLDRLNLEAEVTSMPSGKYSGNIVIPTSVVYNSNTYTVIGIGKEAFGGCAGLTAVVIPEGITDIGDKAFIDCTALTSVVIPESVKTLGYGGTFQRCTNLRSVKWNAISCKLLTNQPGTYSAPFSDLANLTDFTFGDKVSVLPPNLCFGIKGLTSIVIPENITSMGIGGTFQQCTGLKSVQWNAIHCVITENENGDGNYYPPFRYLSSITSFTFGEKVELITASVCVGLTGLTSITIPNSVKDIESIAFRYCSGLTSITIPDGVTDIRISAFRDCTGLKTLYLGSNIKNLEDKAFRDCTGLTSITCEALVPPAVGEDAFLNVNRSIPLYVHCPSAKAYKAAEQWKEFQIGCESLTATIAQDCSLNGTNYSASHPLPDTAYPLTLKADGCATPNTYVCYDGQDAELTAVPQEGYSFKQWDDGNTDNPRYISVTGNMTLTALFSRDGCDLFNAALTIPEMCADEDSLFISVSYTDNEPDAYTVAFDDKAVAQGFKAAYTGKVRRLSSGSAQIAIPLPAPATDDYMFVRPNNYQMNITLEDECDNALTFAQLLTVYYPSYLIFQRWNDVLSLSNEDYNGHYRFSSIRWFHEGTPLAARGDNDAYICVSPDSLVFGDAYWVELTRADDGVTMTSCPFYPVRMDDKMVLGDVITPYITVTPQVLQQGNRVVSVKTNICGTYFVYRPDGTLLSRRPFCPAPDETFTIDLASYDAGTGMYMIAFQGIEGTSVTAKILVEP